MIDWSLILIGLVFGALGGAIMGCITGRRARRKEEEAWRIQMEEVLSIVQSKSTKEKREE